MHAPNHRHTSVRREGGPGARRAVLGLLATLGALFVPARLAADPATADTYLGNADPAAGLLGEMNLVPVTSAEVDEATERIRRNLDATAAAAEHQARAEQGLRELADGLAALERQRTDLEAQRQLAEVRANEAAVRRARHEAEAAAVQRVLDEVVTAAYIGGGQPAEDLLEDPAFTESGRRARYADDVFAEMLGRKRADIGARDQAAADVAAAEADRARHVEALVTNQAEIEANGRAQVEAGAERDAAIADQAHLRGELESLKVDLATARRTARVVGADFPLVVLDAFQRAVAWEAENRPRCQLPWQLLAGISKIESNHGTYGGSVVSASGDTTAIVGPRLDGSPGVAAIADSDGGRYDGDPVYDRAVGPMQFIPTSWRIFGGDGNGDGVADPRNYYDATLAAAEHLCRAGHDVATPEGFRLAVLSYNQSDAYVQAVTLSMHRYTALDVVTPTAAEGQAPT